MFNVKIESLIFIFLFILTVLAGFKTIIDLYKNSNFNLDLTPLRDFFEDESMRFYSSLMFSPIITMMLSIILMVAVYLYAIGSNIPLNFLLFLSVVLILYICIQLGNYFSMFPMFIVLGIPIVLIIISLILMMVTIANYNSNTSARDAQFTLSNINHPEMLKYKISMILEFTLMFFWLFYLYITEDRVDKTSVQFYSYAILPVLYGGSSYMVYVANGLSKMKFADISKQS
jgi:hypothetical protein